MGNTFYKKVARCKLCGGILISADSMQRGYGPACYRKRDKGGGKDVEDKVDVPITGQVTIFDYLEESKM